MANAKVVYNTLISKLNLPESAEEISALAFATLQHLGVSRTDVVGGREVDVEMNHLDAVIQRLNQHEPLQYIFNEAWFYGRKFFVNSNVLIPRPETELLIDIAKKNFLETDAVSILDIGMGSGCIAITLALEFPNSKVTALDVSTSALQVAQQNAEMLNASVNFIESDILKGFDPDLKFDFIVSNPPYIAHSEKHTMLPNVLQYEPHLALFASEADPLIFYRAISTTAAGILKRKGFLAVEINERLSQEVAKIFEEAGLNSSMVQIDTYGKPRAVIAQKD